jgi:hypothetical protein
MTLTVTRAWRSSVQLDEEIGTGASGVLEFSNIPQNYRHLQISLMGRSDAAATSSSVHLTFETSPTAGAYNHQRLTGAAATAAASENVGASDFIHALTVPAASSTANLYGGGEIIIFEYTNTGMMKMVNAQQGGATNVATGAIVAAITTGVWESTDAISLIRLTLAAGNWTTLSRATLYGVPR